PMTDREPGAPDDALTPEETDEEPLPDEGFDDADVDDEADADGLEDEEEEIDERPAAAAPGRRGSITSAEARRSGPAGPSVSERAVHLDDRASAIFVLGIVATFVGIVLYALLAGEAGFFTPLATETPFPTEAPSASVSASPSAAPSA